MTCHEFLEWTDSLSPQDWRDMSRDIFTQMNQTVALAYMMRSTPTTESIFGRVHSVAMSDINAARDERRRLTAKLQTGG